MAASREVRQQLGDKAKEALETGINDQSLWMALVERLGNTAFRVLADSRSYNAFIRNEGETVFREGAIKGNEVLHKAIRTDFRHLLDEMISASEFEPVTLKALKAYKKETDFNRVVSAAEKELLEKKFETLNGGIENNFLNFANGILNFDSGEFTTERGDSIYTMQMGFDYDPTATDCPHFDSLVAHICQSKTKERQKDVEQMLLTHLSFSFVNGNPNGTMLILTGRDGLNGKSTLTKAINALCGDGDTSYGCEVGRQAVEQAKSGNENSGDGQRILMKGKRFADMPELGDVVINEGEFKQMVDVGLQGKARGRLLNRDAVSFTQTATLISSSNADKVTIKGQIEPVMRRMLPIRVHHQIENADTSYPAKLKAEAAAIFNLLMRTWKEYRANYSDGRLLEVPESVELERQAWVLGNSALPSWIRTNLEQTSDEKEFAKFKDVLDRYKADNFGVKESRQSFAPKLKSLNIETYKHQGRETRLKGWKLKGF